MIEGVISEEPYEIANLCRGGDTAESAKKSLFLAIYLRAIDRKTARRESYVYQQKDAFMACVKTALRPKEDPRAPRQEIPPPSDR